MTDGTGTTAYQYDALDRPITVTNGAGHSVGYGYDAVGNTTAITYPDSSVITRSYDRLDRLSSVRDWLGHTARFGYNAADNLITQTLPTSTTTNIGMGYDAAERLTGITDTTPPTSWAYAYSRDKAGEIVGAVDPLDGKAHTYSYDKLAGLIGDSQGSSGVTSTVGWTNDAAREVTRRLDPSGPYTSTLTYDNAHELTGTTTLSGTVTVHNLAYTYNKDGDRTGQTDSVGGASRSYGYDQADRLITATVGVTTSAYSYDGDGLRQSKVITTTQGTTTTAETWDTAEGRPALLQDGATRYIAGPDGLPIEQVNPDGSIQYYLRDQLGSTRALLDGAGHTVATYSYDAYGNPTGRAGNTTTPFGYAGAYTDAETGLQYLQARYYDPATQQFVSVDPLVDQTKQPYAYTAADPLNAIDPTGLCPSGGFCPWEGVGQALAWGGDQIKLKARDGLLAASSGLARFNQSDLSDAVYGDVAGLAHAGQGLYDQATQCARGWGTALGCAQATAAFASYAQTHPWELGVMVVQAQVAQLAQYKHELDCHQYGALAGHLLVAFALSKGTGALGEIGGAATEGATGVVERDVSQTALRDAETPGLRSDVPGCEGCFAAGTRVATPHGAVAIQSLKVGQTVLSEDPTTHKVEAEPIQRVLHDPSSPLVAVDLSDGSTITTTLTHSFWVDAGARIARGGAWLWAEHLRPGDQLRTADGRLVSVARVRTGVGRADVWTLTVAKDHTFFVGSAQVLVHNANRCDPKIVLYRTTIDRSVWGRGERVHFNRANANLDADLQAHPEFAQRMDDHYPGVRDAVSRHSSSVTPYNLTWHHSEDPGVMELVPYDDHQTNSSIYHPTGRGGYAIWAVPAGAPPRG